MESSTPNTPVLTACAVQINTLPQSERVNGAPSRKTAEGLSVRVVALLTLAAFINYV